MGKKLEDLGLPKDVTAKKTLDLYKAFVITDPGQKMTINQNIEVLYTDYFVALDHFLDQYTLEELQQFKDRIDVGDYPTVSYAVISVDLEDLRDKDLVDEGEAFYENGQMAITLSDKLFTVAVGDALITKLSFEVDPETEQRKYIFDMEGYGDKEKQEKRRTSAMNRKAKKKSSQEPTITVSTF